MASLSCSWSGVAEDERRDQRLGPILEERDQLIVGEGDLVSGAVDVVGHGGYSVAV